MLLVVFHHGFSLGKTAAIDSLWSLSVEKQVTLV